jgi:hypothetical protein
LELLRHVGIRFLVGGAYALERHTGIQRHTKDLDVFVLPADSKYVLEAFADAGYRTELTFAHWLGKIYGADDFIDVIFSSGNGLCRVDEEWWAHAADFEVLGVPVQVCPAEEMIWSKAFVQERERYDGADITHLLRARARELDWQRLLRRFGPHWQLLLSQLLLFRFVYPAERGLIPDAVLHGLLDRLRNDMSQMPPDRRVCQGTLLSRSQYLPDIERWGYQDARLQPLGSMNAAEIARWTAAMNDPPPALITRPVPSGDGR